MSPRNPPLTKSAGLFGEGEKPGRAAGPACQFRMLRRQNPSPGERQSPVILAVPAGRPASLMLTLIHASGVPITPSIFSSRSPPLPQGPSPRP